MKIKDAEGLSDAELERAYNEHQADVNRPVRPGAVPFDGVDVSGMPVDLAQAERRAILGVLPRKSLWPELDEFNRRSAELQGRQRDVESRLQRLHEQRINAPSVDAQAAADWEFAGRKGPRPEPSVGRLDAEAADAERERDGLQGAVDRALEDRGRFVEKNRDRLASVAAQQGDALLARLGDLFDEVVETRDKLAELAAAERWARLYPHELADRDPQTSMLGGGLLQAVKPLGINQQLEYVRMIDALRADATWLRRAAATNEQRALLDGRDPRTGRGAVWADTDEYRAQRKAELDEAVRAFVAEWGRQPTEAQLAAFIDARNR